MSKNLNSLKTLEFSENKAKGEKFILCSLARAFSMISQSTISQFDSSPNFNGQVSTLHISSKRAKGSERNKLHAVKFYHMLLGSKWVRENAIVGGNIVGGTSYTVLNAYACVFSDTFRLQEDIQ